MAILETQSATAVEPTLEDVADTVTELEYVGVEFEYPVAGNEDRAPATRALGSGGLRSEYRGEYWPGIPDVPDGQVGSDHVGAEIRSAPMNLHTTEPELWYSGIIERAEQAGYPFAACGYGDTTFGLHLNLSPLRDEKVGALREWIDEPEPWVDPFFCASVTEDGADPWRHGGGHVVHQQRDSQITFDETIGGYYEFRLPEPGVPEHFAMMMHFMRLLDVEGPEAAKAFAEERVYERDSRLTSVQQYNYYKENVDGWLDSAFDDRGRAQQSSAAENMGEIMGDL